MDFIGIIAAVGAGASQVRPHPRFRQAPNLLHSHLCPFFSETSPTPL